MPTIKELKILAKRFREDEANPVGLPKGTTALRADTAYLWVSRFLDFVDEKTYQEEERLGSKE